MSLPQLMRAVVFDRPGGVGVLEVKDIPIPRPGRGEVLVQAVGAGVNRPDVLQRLGLYPPPADACPRLGLEVSGRVVACGEGVSPSELGREVMALANGGAYAEYVCVPVGQCLEVPPGVSLLEAASLPETYLTVYQNLFKQTKPAVGSHLLVHGGASGIGCAAIQLAKMFGLTVHVTVGSELKAAFCRGLGADFVYLHKTEDWVRQARQNSGKGIDLVLDMVAGPYLSKDIECLSIGGRIQVIALLGGRKAEIDCANLLGKRANIQACTLRPQSAEFKAELASEVSTLLGEGFKKGALRTTVSQVMDLDRVAEAHRLMEETDLCGKLILRIGAD